MAKLLELLKKIDDNIVRILLYVFIFLIPLYPKFPLKGINYTYVAIRLEDIFIAVFAVIFAVQVLRKKITFNRKFLWPILIFWGVVLASLISGIFVTDTLPYRQLAFLNALRRVEYMIIFFIASATVTSHAELKKLIITLLTVLFLVNIYGFGQRFFGLPAVQTMNAEYALGHLLRLTPEARISSTFSGHYDLSSYLVFMMPLVWGACFIWKKRNYLFSALALISIIILNLTVSRISFIAYIIVTPFFALFMRKYRYFILIVAFTLLVNYFNKDLTNRFMKTIQKRQILVNLQTGEIFIPQKITTKELPAGSAVMKLNQKQAPVKITTEAAVLKETIIKRTETRTDLSLASREAKIKDILANLKPMTGFVYDISFATRIQVEWPRAILAFTRNPLLGTGPSSITEATDNDFLRWLGETGLLGFSSFLFILGAIMVFVFKKTRLLEPEVRPMYYAFIFALLALLINATYIDVFEASKVAFTFWTVTGIYVGALSHVKKTPEKKRMKKTV